MTDEMTQPAQVTKKRGFSFMRLLGFLFNLLIIIYIFGSGYFMYNLYMDIKKLNTTVFPKAAFADTDLPGLAKDIGLNVGEFNKCLSSGSVDKIITDDFNNGRDVGVQGTPGSVLLDMKTQRAIRIDGGALPLDIINTIVKDFKDGMSTDEINKYMASVQAGQVADVNNLRPIGKADHQRGAKNPTFAFVEYSDLQCPYCSRFHPTVKQLADAYPNDMLWVYRHFPLTSIHQYAQKFAEGSECAAAQQGDKAFWQVADGIFAAELQ